MSLKIATKLVVLLTALTMSVLAIFWLKQGHMGAFWTSLGLSSSEARVNWCEERVESLYLFSNDAKLFEEKAEWLWQNGNNKPRSLNYLSAEKWFAKYCQLPIEPIESPPQEAAGAVFEAKFLDGGRITLFAYPSGAYKFRDRAFRSETLRQALKELLAFGEEIE